MSAFHDNALMGASGQQGYQISRSVRLRSSATAYFSRTNNASTNRTTWTFSAWVKRGKLGAYQSLFAFRNASNNYSEFWFDSNDNLHWDDISSGTTQTSLITSAVYRDPSAWYHVILAYDSTNATAVNRARLYVNGTQITSLGTATYPAQNTQSIWNYPSVSVAIGAETYQPAYYFDGYLTEVNFIDGQALTPSSFGETDTLTGVWKPKKYAGTYGTNGFYLNFSDNSSNTATTIGKDYSGNGNNWTPNNISVTAGVTYDSMTDVPTLTSATAANYCVLNPLAPSSYVTISAGNLTATGNTATNSGMAVASFGVSSGKYVWEETITTVSGNFPGVGATTVILQDGNGQNPAASNTQGVYYRANGTVYKNSASLVGTYATFSNGDVVRFELDADALTCAIYKNNTLIVTVTGLTAGTFFPSNVNYNSSVTNSNFGQRPFANTPNTGFVALNTQNLPAPTISNGAQYMAATTYTGNGSTQTISNSVNGVSFAPDFVWVKYRNQAYNHDLFDSIRGVSKYLRSNSTTAELTYSGYGVTAFNSNGFSVTDDSGGNYEVNGSSGSLVGWQWKGGGTAVSNTAGTITSSVSANPTAGFSVVTYTGNGSAGATCGHGLGVSPSMIIWKNRNDVDVWIVYHKALTTSEYMVLNTTAAKATYSGLFTGITSTVIPLNNASAGINASAKNYVAYCFAEVAGYSKFGSYTGNGSANGPFVYLGFRPRFVMIKDTTNAGTYWIMYDTSRNTYNLTNTALYANSSSAEGAYQGIDVLSNGFKLRAAGVDTNGSGATIVYAAFAENPFRNSLAR